MNPECYQCDLWAMPLAAFLT